MAVSPVQDAPVFGLDVRQGMKMLPLVMDASAEMAIGADWPPMLFLDPAGGAKTVLLPAEADSKGLMFVIVNTADGVEVLTVEEDSSTTAIATIAQFEMAILVCDGTTWYSLVGTNT